MRSHVSTPAASAPTAATPTSAPPAIVVTRVPASESSQPPSGDNEPKPRYVLGAAALAAVLVITWVSMKLLSGQFSDSASGSAANVALADASGGDDSAAGDTTSGGGTDLVDNTVDEARMAISETRATSVNTRVGADARGDGAATTVRAPATTVSRISATGVASIPRNAPTARATSTRFATVESNELPPEISEVIPEVPSKASRTIRGSVRVSVRLIVEKDGTVFAALADNPGPSRYFERLAVDAAKKWTFAPIETDEQRLMLLRFTFTRQGTTATATALE
jgi:TonB family protein